MVYTQIFTPKENVSKRVAKNACVVSEARAHPLVRTSFVPPKLQRREDVKMPKGMGYGKKAVKKLGKAKVNKLRKKKGMKVMK